MKTLNEKFDFLNKHYKDTEGWGGDETFQVFTGLSGYTSIKIKSNGFYSIECTRGCSDPVDTFPDIEAEIDKHISKIEQADYKPKEIVIDGVRYLRQ